MRKLIACLTIAALLLPLAPEARADSRHCAQPVEVFATSAVPPRALIYHFSPPAGFWVRLQAAGLAGLSLLTLPTLTAAPAGRKAASAQTHKSLVPSTKMVADLESVLTNSAENFGRAVSDLNVKLDLSSELFHRTVRVDDDLRPEAAKWLASVWALSAASDPGLSLSQTPSWLAPLREALATVNARKTEFDQARSSAKKTLDLLPAKNRDRASLKRAVSGAVKNAARLNDQLSEMLKWTLQPGAAPRVTWRSNDLEIRQSYESGGKALLLQFQGVSIPTQDNRFEIGFLRLPKEYDLTAPKGDTPLSAPQPVGTGMVFANTQDLADFVAGTSPRSPKYEISTAIEKLFPSATPSPNAPAPLAIPLNVPNPAAKPATPTGPLATPSVSDSTKITRTKFESLFDTDPAGRELASMMGSDNRSDLVADLWAVLTHDAFEAQKEPNVSWSVATATLQLIRGAVEPVLSLLPPVIQGQPVIRRVVIEEAMRRAVALANEPNRDLKDLISRAKGALADRSSLAAQFKTASENPRAGESAVSRAVNVVFRSIENAAVKTDGSSSRPKPSVLHSPAAVTWAVLILALPLPGIVEAAATVVLLVAVTARLFSVNPMPFWLSGSRLFRRGKLDNAEAARSKARRLAQRDFLRYDVPQTLSEYIDFAQLANYPPAALLKDVRLLPRSTEPYQLTLNALSMSHSLFTFIELKRLADQFAARGDAKADDLEIVLRKIQYNALIDSHVNRRTWDGRGNATEELIIAEARKWKSRPILGLELAGSDGITGKNLFEALNRAGLDARLEVSDKVIKITPVQGLDANHRLIFSSHGKLLQAAATNGEKLWVRWSLLIYFKGIKRLVLQAILLRFGMVQLGGRERWVHHLESVIRRAHFSPTARVGETTSLWAPSVEATAKRSAGRLVLRELDIEHLPAIGPRYHFIRNMGLDMRVGPRFENKTYYRGLSPSGRSPYFDNPTIYRHLASQGRLLVDQGLLFVGIEGIFSDDPMEKSRLYLDVYRREGDALVYVQRLSRGYATTPPWPLIDLRLSGDLSEPTQHDASFFPTHPSHRPSRDSAVLFYAA